MNFTSLLVGHHDERAIERISSTLDRMDPTSRLSTVLSIRPKQLPVLWDLMAGQNMDAAHFVPSGTPLQPVIHNGINSLPSFRRFQKRFMLADDGTGELWGYNHQTFGWLTGPGYFVAHASEEADAPSPYVVDYTRLPPKQPPSWPKVVRNEAGFGRFVYANQKDYMRRVAEHVCIGAAYRHGKQIDVYFILCREA
jgi:hypothetical protein